MAREPVRKPADAAAQLALRDYQRCVERANAEFEHCALVNRMHSGGEPTCYRPVCFVPPGMTESARGAAPDPAECEQASQDCHRKCIWRVEARTVCEANC